jgi:hypothetical protein
LTGELRNYYEGQKANLQQLRSRVESGRYVKDLRLHDYFLNKKIKLFLKY